jgi:hypothetical protein
MSNLERAFVAGIIGLAFSVVAAFWTYAVYERALSHRERIACLAKTNGEYLNCTRDRSF